MNPYFRNFIARFGISLFVFTSHSLADYYSQDFTSYYVGAKLTADNDSLRFYFSIPDSGAVLAGFVLSSDTDWQECDNESAVLDICVDQNDSTRQVVITYMGRKKFEYPRYLWELGSGDHYIDIIFNPLKSAPKAEYVNIDSVKIALVRPDNPYFYPCLIIPYLNTYKIYSKDDIPLIVYYNEPDQNPVRRYYHNIIFSHDTGHIGDPEENQDYEQFWSDRASSLDVEWYWDVTVDVSNDTPQILEKYFQGTSHTIKNYGFPLRNFHPTLKVASSNNNFEYGFGTGDAKNRYPQLIPPLNGSDYHAFYDSHPEILEIWVKEIRRDYGMYDFDCRHEEAPPVFATGYHHDPDKFYFTDPAYHLYFNYTITGNTGRDLGIYIKLSGNNRWYGRKVISSNGQHWQSIVLPDFIDLNDVDSLRISSAGETGTEIQYDFTKVYFFDQDVNFIDHRLNFPVNQSISSLEKAKSYLFGTLFSDELTLQKLKITVSDDSIHFYLPFCGDLNENSIANLNIKETGASEYSRYDMYRKEGAFSYIIPYAEFDSIYDIMVKAEDVDGVSGYSPQYIEEMDFSVLSTIQPPMNLKHSFSLKQNYPNPFNPSTTINYELAITNYVNLSIYNLLGQKLATLVNKKQVAGNYQVQWDATGFASGIYICRLEAKGQWQKALLTQKLILIK